METIANLACGETLGAFLDEQAKDFEAGLLSQSAQSTNCGVCFHISTFIELSKRKVKGGKTSCSLIAIGSGGACEGGRFT
jgi:hypothetical protein